MRRWVWKAAGAALAVSLLLPWFYGTDDGQALVVAGWDTEPGFTLGMLACAAAIVVAGLIDRPPIAAPAAVVAIALTIWMLPREDRYSGDDLGPGAIVALVVAVVALAAAVRPPSRSSR